MIGPLVSLIIPAYNEEATVGWVIKATANVMSDFGYPYEIIVVNDGSIDNTERAAFSTGFAKVLSNKTNRGKGYSIREGVKHAKGDIIVTLDADGEHNPQEIPSLLLPLLKGKQIVAGSRFMSNSHKVTTTLHQVGNHLFNFAILLMTGNRVSDSQTGFRAMKKSVFEKLELQSDGYEIETEITIKSLINGFSIKEVPITIKRRRYSISKIKIISDSKKILSTIIRSGFSTNQPVNSLNFSNTQEITINELAITTPTIITPVKRLKVATDSQNKSS